MRRFLVVILLITLAACAQSPAPADDRLSGLAPLVFGTPGYDEVRSLARHGSGVYVTGLTDGNMHGANKGAYDAFVRKYGAGRAVLWGRQFGTAGRDVAHDAASDGGNNAYVVGFTEGNLAGSLRGDSDAFIRKYTASGGVAWSRQFGTAGYDTARGAATSYTGAVYVVGLLNYDAFIRKYTASGSIAWTRMLGSTDFAEPTDVAVDGSGNAYVVGHTSGSLGPPYSGYLDLFIRKYTASGSVAWTQQLPGSHNDYAAGVAVTGSSVYVAGRFTHKSESWTDLDVRIAKYTTAGMLLWNTRFGAGSNEIVEAITADSSGVLFSGRTDGSIGGWNRGGHDGFVVKFDPNGNFAWAAQQGTSADDGTSALVVRGASEIYAAGQTDGVLGGSNRGGTDVFLRRLNGTTGATVWTDQ